MLSKEEIIRKLDLLAHPEGGYFKEVYRSSGSVGPEALPKEFASQRNFATSIYFLLEHGNFSAFHKINQDETWHFYLGSPIRIHMISPDGKYSSVVIGQDLANDVFPQYTVSGHVWFAAEVLEPGGFGLVGCTVAPGFDFDDFVLAEFDALVAKFPDHQEVIRRFTR